jgi:hypothetical protein
VYVRLVTGVKDQLVLRRVEDAVHRDRQRHDAEVRSRWPLVFVTVSTRTSRISLASMPSWSWRVP